MQYVAYLAMMMVFVSGPGPQVQRRSQTGPVTFAIFVTDPAGAPIGGVSVTVEGPAKRQAMTEAGRIALENLPAGTYHFIVSNEMSNTPQGIAVKAQVKCAR